MIIKLQCINEAAAIAAHAHWPDDTIRQGRSLICIHLSPHELAVVQQQANAFTVELTDYDQQLIERTLQGDHQRAS